MCRGQWNLCPGVAVSPGTPRRLGSLLRAEIQCLSLCSVRSHFLTRSFSPLMISRDPPSETLCDDYPSIAKYCFAHGGMDCSSPFQVHHTHHDQYCNFIRVLIDTTRPRQTAMEQWLHGVYASFGLAALFFEVLLGAAGARNAGRATTSPQCGWLTQICSKESPYTERYDQQYSASFAWSLAKQLQFKRTREMFVVQGRQTSVDWVET